MAHPAVTVPPSLFRLLRMLVLGNLFMVGGIVGMSVGTFGLGSITVWACAAVVGLSIVLYPVAAVRQRPRVVLTPDGFASDKLFGREAHRWEDVDGRFGVIEVGWNKVVAYKLTADYKARVGKKPTSLFSGYDAALGGALALSAAELAELLNEYKQRHQGSTSPGG